MTKLHDDELLYMVTNCPVCGSTQKGKLYLQGNIRIDGLSPDDMRITDHQYGKCWNFYRCPECDCLYANPRPSSGTLERLYGSMEDSVYESEAHTRKLNFESIFKTLEKWQPKPGHLLDIGCATGLLLEVASERGWSVEGIEPSQALAQQARAKGFQVYQTTLENWTPSRMYDCITMIDVIEHVVEPQPFFEKAFSLLNPDGWLILVTPDVGSFFARIFRRRWWHYRPAHVTFFTRKTIRHLARMYNGRIMKMRFYVWHFTMDYLLSRLNKGRSVSWVPRFIRNRKIPLNLFDSMEVYIQKVRTQRD